MSEVHALFGIHSLKNLPRAIENRIAVCTAYNALFNADGRVYVPQKAAEQSETGQYYPIVFPEKIHRDQAYDALKNQGILTRKYFYPALHKLKAYSSQKNRKLPVTEFIADRVLCLPLHSGMSADQAKLVYNALSVSFDQSGIPADSSKSTLSRMMGLKQAKV